MNLLTDNPRRVNDTFERAHTIHITRDDEGRGLVWVKDKHGVWRGWPA